MKNTRVRGLMVAAFAACMVLVASQAKALDLPGDSTAKKMSGLGGSGWLTQGAEILPMGKHALAFRVGFPSTDFEIHFPVAKKFEISAIWSIDYLPYGGWIGYFGDTFGMQLKGNLYAVGPHAVSLGADIGLITSYFPALNIGVQIGGPELKYSYRWNNPRIAIITGLRMPIQVWALGLSVNIPILPNIGFEYNVTKRLNIHANFELGPNVCVVPGVATVVLFHAGFQFGISYLF